MIFISIQTITLNMINDWTINLKSNFYNSNLFNSINNIKCNKIIATLKTQNYLNINKIPNYKTQHI
jgi:hypothetical protein